MIALKGVHKGKSREVENPSPFPAPTPLDCSPHISTHLNSIRLKFSRNLKLRRINRYLILNVSYYERCTQDEAQSRDPFSLSKIKEEGGGRSVPIGANYKLLWNLIGKFKFNDVSTLAIHECPSLATRGYGVHEKSSVSCRRNRSPTELGLGCRICGYKNMEGVFQGRSLHTPSFMYLKLLQLLLTCRHNYATISPELPHTSLNTRYELELEFPVLSDVSYARSLGIVWKQPDVMKVVLVFT